MYSFCHASGVFMRMHDRHRWRRPAPSAAVASQASKRASDLSGSGNNHAETHEIVAACGGAFLTAGSARPWFPIGTFAANMLATALAFACPVALRSVATHSSVVSSQQAAAAGTCFATGFLGSLSTVSTFVAEVRFIVTTLCHQVKQHAMRWSCQTLCAGVCDRCHMLSPRSSLQRVGNCAQSIAMAAMQTTSARTARST